MLRLESLVDLGGGDYRYPRPGEELFRFVLLPLNRRLPWMTEQRLLAEAGTLSIWGRGDIEIETMVVPGARPGRGTRPAPARAAHRGRVTPIEWETRATLLVQERDRLRGLVRDLVGLLTGELSSDRYEKAIDTAIERARRELGEENG